MVHKEGTDRWEHGCICGMHLVLMSLYVSTPSQERPSSYSIYLDSFFFGLVFIVFLKRLIFFIYN